VFKDRASAQAFGLVRVGQISGADESAECGDEMLADLLASAPGLELVDIEIRGDRGPSVSYLTLPAEGVESGLCEMARRAQVDGDPESIVSRRCRRGVYGRPWFPPGVTSRPRGPWSASHTLR